MGGGSTNYSSSDYSFDDKPAVTRKSAADYAASDNRRYVAPTRVRLPSVKETEMKTDGKLAMAIMLDTTGSMYKLPGFFFERTPAIYVETNAAMQGKDLKQLKSGEKLEDLLDVGIISVGDTASDQIPIQAFGYCHGQELVENIKKILPSGRGGGNAVESYDLAAYYLLKHSKTPQIPQGLKPLLIIIGDEGFYEDIKPEDVKAHLGDEIPGVLKTADVYKALMKKFDVFMLRPEPIGEDGRKAYEEDTYKQIHKQWTGVLGPERVLKMDDTSRLVDDIVMVTGIYTKNYKRTMEYLERRQIDPDHPEEGLTKLNEVLNTLHPILGAKAVATEKARLRKKYSAR